MLLEGTGQKRAQNREKYLYWSSFSSFISFVPIFCFLASHDYEKLNYTLLGGWIPNTL